VSDLFDHVAAQALGLGMVLRARAVSRFEVGWDPLERHPSGLELGEREAVDGVAKHPALSGAAAVSADGVGAIAVAPAVDMARNAVGGRIAAMQALHVAPRGVMVQGLAVEPDHPDNDAPNDTLKSTSAWRSAHPVIARDEPLALSYEVGHVPGGGVDTSSVAHRAPVVMPADEPLEASHAGSHAPGSGPDTPSASYAARRGIEPAGPLAPDHAGSHAPGYGADTTSAAYRAPVVLPADEPVAASHAGSILDNPSARYVARNVISPAEQLPSSDSGSHVPNYALDTPSAEHSVRPGSSPADSLPVSHVDDDVSGGGRHTPFTGPSVSTVMALDEPQAPSHVASYVPEGERSTSFYRLTDRAIIARGEPLALGHLGSDASGCRRNIPLGGPGAGPVITPEERLASSPTHTPVPGEGRASQSARPKADPAIAPTVLPSPAAEGDSRASQISRPPVVPLGSAVSRPLPVVPLGSAASRPLPLSTAESPPLYVSSAVQRHPLPGTMHPKLPDAASYPKSQTRSQKEGQRARRRQGSELEARPDSKTPAAIEITIGRLEIRTEPVALPRPSKPFRPNIDLATYKARREGGQ
jgi:hypothetical protein